MCASLCMQTNQLIWPISMLRLGDKLLCSNISLMQHVLSYLLALNCDPDCVNGNCTTPGFCSCDAGWRGTTCEDGNVFCSLYVALIQCSLFSDIDECALGSSICGHNCTNIIGSYYCTCRSGFELDYNRHNCSGTISVHLNNISYLGMMLLIYKHKAR